MISTRKTIDVISDIVRAGNALHRAFGEARGRGAEAAIHWAAEKAKHEAELRAQTSEHEFQLAMAQATAEIGEWRPITNVRAKKLRPSIRKRPTYVYPGMDP